MTQHTAEITEQSQSRTPAGKLVRTNGGFVWHIGDENKASDKTLEENGNISRRGAERGTVRVRDDVSPQPNRAIEREPSDTSAVDGQSQNTSLESFEQQQHIREQENIRGFEADLGGTREPSGRWQRRTGVSHGPTEDSQAYAGSQNVHFRVISARPRPHASGGQKSPSSTRGVSAWTRLMNRIAKTAKRFEAAPTTWSDHFQRGALAGLVLGCLSLILFHQVTLPAASAASSGQVENSSSNVRPALAPSSAFQVTLPSAQVYMMEFGPFRTTTAAHTAEKQLGQAGVTAEVIQNSNGYSVWVHAALARQDAVKMPVKLSSSRAKSSVDMVGWAAESLPTTLVDTGAGSAAANQWLAEVVTALRVETGAAAGETATRDVLQAVKNANKQKPADSIWSAGSVPASFGALDNDVTAASTLLSRNETQQAEGEILKAWAELYAIRQQALAAN
ncbi:hypothetical protein [Alicyclobacillus ferrooxydans]|uniref:SPOR domain-containing protein n=1 Tax=Alicyclobacillus ferrooxydans TaxID=471514 RepID=A0A0P9CCH8_9BACL|nr:hypothetical protein [Alicyclobacillus ferrooxydans]KPV43225.1 hypothetical protein AN477_13300 [Alicyclobacillus ferrooxydans]